MLKRGIQSISVYDKIQLYSVFVVRLFPRVQCACSLVADVTDVSTVLQLTVFHG